jgi:hypothetical protein
LTTAGPPGENFRTGTPAISTRTSLPRNHVLKFQVQWHCRRSVREIGDRTKGVIGMLTTVAIGATLVLLGLATLVGVIDGRSQRSAWNRIAVARRGLFEVGQALDDRETALDVREDELDARSRRLRAAERRLDARTRLPAAVSVGQSAPTHETSVS